MYEPATGYALEGISLDVVPGSWTAVTGGNGSGKSTLLGVLAGVVPLHNGHLDRNARRVAVLMQDPDNQFVASDVAGELALSLDPGAGRRDVRIAEAVDRFALGPLLPRSPRRLSGGEKQRLAMASVWLEAPDVLLLDEPLAYLDEPTRALVTGFVREMNDAGAAVVWATPGEDVPLAQAAVVLDDGRMSYRGDAAGVPRPAPDAGDGAPLPSVRPAPSTGVRPALTMEDVGFVCGESRVFDHLDLQVAAGESVGVFGHNSAGKSTLLLVAGGALAPARGRVTRGEGAPLYLPQSPERLFFAETVAEELAFGLRRRGSNPEEALRRAAESLERCGLDPAAFLDRSPFQLSFGEMRRVAFAIADSLAPSLLLLDEPASCLDAAGRRVLHGLVSRRVTADGAVMVASHDLNHLQWVSHRIVPLTQPSPADSIPANTPTRRH